MRPTDEIEPLVPELSRGIATDGGERDHKEKRRRARKTFDDPEDGAPLVPNISY